MSRKPAPAPASGASSASSSSSDLSVIRIKPYYYIHVHDSNTSVTRVEVGPQTFTRKDHEKIVFGPEQMVMIPPRFYVVIANPVQRKGVVPVFDDFGNAKLRHGDEEVRFEQDPFPLYPGEQLQGKINPLQVVAPNTALRLRALRDFKDHEIKRNAGDEWLFPGPATYYPRVDVQIVEIVKAVIVKPNTALKLRARKDFTDFYGKPRRVGEEWIVLEEGAYLPNVDEEIVETVRAYILTQDKALHLRASKTFKDRHGNERKAGEEWLITNADKEVHIPDIFEEVLGERKLTTLNNRQYCVVVDPIGPSGKPQLGKRELRKGEVCFFLRPGESLERGIQNVEVLGEEEALLLRAREEFVDGTEKHPPGDRWMIYGPCDYVPPVEVEILEKRRSIPLDKNEGIYARDIKTGTVRAVVGQTYMLKPYEELWEKDLPKVVEELLAASLRSPEEDRPASGVPARDRTRVVSYRAPHNTTVQIYDYKEKKSRLVFGPDLVMLGPDEQFTVLSLSGDKPKRPHVIKALGLQLGPEFMTDIVIVETSDHARLSLKLSYNWYFEVDKSSEESVFKLFQVPDFVGDACKAIASRVRGAVAAVSFDHFHKNSARTIRTAVFGLDDRSKVRDKFIFSANNLVITNIDIQSVEPVDQKTRDSLQKSVQLAIEITTKSQEAAAKHEAERAEQEAKGKLERQKLSDEAEAEKARKELLALQSQSHVVEETGRATAEAKARAEAARIEGEAAVGEARLRAEATRIRADADIIQLRKRQASEISYQKSLNDLTLHRAKALADIEASKFHSIVDAIGSTTIESIARAGPEMQAKLLSGLGLKSFLITDGSSPINLFNTANGLLGGAPGGSSAPVDESL